MEAVSGTVFVAFAVVGVVELLKQAWAKNWQSVAVIVLAGIVGALVSIFHTQLGVSDITVAQGIMNGLGASGLVTTATRIG